MNYLHSDEAIRNAKMLRDQLRNMPQADRARIAALNRLWEQIQKDDAVQDDRLKGAENITPHRPSVKGQLRGRKVKPQAQPQVLELVVNYCNGETLEGLAESYGLAAPRVVEMLVDAGVVLRDRSAARNDRLLQAPRFREQGMSYREIGARLGISHTTVIRMLARS